MGDFVSGLLDDIEKVTRKWADQNRREIREASARAGRRSAFERSTSITVQDAAWSVMEEAYLKASGGGTLPVKPRQIMYAARGHIQGLTGKRLDDRYFCQTILPDYCALNGGLTAGWDIVWDARGSLVEPHTNLQVPLGTLEVREYLAGGGSRYLVREQQGGWSTRGPDDRFGAVLFVEKEGFMPLFRAVRLAERHDLAIMSSKGLSTTAARELVDHLVGEKRVPVFCVRDFDDAGFKIAGTLREGTRRYAWRSRGATDLGLRGEDAEAWDLEREEVFYKGAGGRVLTSRADIRAKIAPTLRGYGATREEIETLLTHRVELNAFASDRLVAWIEGKLVEHGVGKVIPGPVGSSYSEPYAARDARRMRDLVRSPWYQRLWGDRVRLDRVAETSFSNDAQGSRDGVPMARLTAGRADLLILDDPHSVAEVESDAERERTVRLFRESVTTRVNDPRTTAIVVVMQRLHERDISGVITGEDFGYTHLLLPMRYEPERRCRTCIGFEDPRTEPGQLLFPERFPEHVVARDERAMGSYAVASQYQQRPAPRAGGMIQVERLDVVRAVPPGALFCRAWDLAATASKPGGDADWSVGALLARHGTQTYVVDVVRFRETAGRRNELIRRTAARDRDAHGTDVVTVVEQEPGSGGKAQVAHLRDLLGREGLTLRQVTPTGSKATRADPLAAAVEAGEVHLAGGVGGGAPWHAPLVDELRTFPAGAHDDQVDAVSTAFNALATRPGVSGRSCRRRWCRSTRAAPATRPWRLPSRPACAAAAPRAGAGPTSSPGRPTGRPRACAASTTATRACGSSSPPAGSASCTPAARWRRTMSGPVVGSAPSIRPTSRVSRASAGWPVHPEADPKAQERFKKPCPA